MRFQQQGIGLIEVLVSLLILAVAILGFSALQVRSVQTTSETIDRTQTLTIMRSFSEKIRANSSNIPYYQQEFNKISANRVTRPNKNCMTQVCNANELAQADVYGFSQQLNGTGLKMSLLPCPATGGTKGVNSVMYSYCLVASWGDTEPTIGADADPADGRMDCLTANGTYHPKSTCMFMEAN